MQKTLSLITSLVSFMLIAGCTSPSTVMPMTDGVYTITKSAPTGFTPLGVIRKAAYDEIKELAEAEGKVAQVVSVNEVAAGFAKWPQVEVRFRLVDGNSVSSTGSASSKSKTSVVFDANGNPIDTETIITEQIEKDVYEELKKIGELRDSGVLTEEEFQKEKAKILNSN